MPIFTLLNLAVVSFTGNIAEWVTVVGMPYMVILQGFPSRTPVSAGQTAKGNVWVFAYGDSCFQTASIA